MKRNTETAPSMSRAMHSWIAGTILPFLAMKLSIESTAENLHDDNPKDIGEMGSIAEENVGNERIKGKIALIEKMLSNSSIIDPKDQEETVNLGSGVIVETGGNEVTVFVSNCDFAALLQEFLKRKSVTLCSTASDLGKEILGKKVNESFTVKGATITVKKILSPKTIENVIMSSGNFKVTTPEIPVQVSAD